jgi:DNA-binding IclR family transcriptional regulator
MAYTFEGLKDKTLAELREIAKGLDHEAVKGWSQMNKEHLLPALCTALNVEAHVHHHVVGLDKSGMKARLRQLKKERDAAIAAHDAKRLHDIRRERHHLKRRIHAATV